MTRKQALYKALETLTNKEAILKINEILEDMPLVSWSEQVIFDTIDQFIIDNGRIPTTTDFKKKGLPPHPVIKLRFGINLKDFLLKYYPKMLCNSKIYYNKTKEQWKDIFISEYLRNKPMSSEEYNKTRGKNTPSWGTVSNMFGISKWLEWLNFCSLERYSCSNADTKLQSKCNFAVKSYYDLEDSKGHIDLDNRNCP